MAAVFLNSCLLGKSISSHLDLDSIVVDYWKSSEENEAISSRLSPLKYIVICPFSFFKLSQEKQSTENASIYMISSHISHWFILPNFDLRYLLFDFLYFFSNYIILNNISFNNFLWIYFLCIFFGQSVVILNCKSLNTKNVFSFSNSLGFILTLLIVALCICQHLSVCFHILKSSIDE